jgi:predicted NACHT family NTPase
MSPDPVSAQSAAVWLWDAFGEKISNLGASAISGPWKKFNWLRAEDQYRSKVHSQLSTIRLLGNSTPIDVESIYTDVEVLDKLSAMRRFNFEDIVGKPIDYDPFKGNERRMSALDIVKGHSRTYILGKPGAGKTTFLKHLAMLACRGQLKETPIYISLKEWSDSRTDLLEFICEKFKICGFPNAKIVIEHLLSNGNALVLLDGLDEVNHEENARRKLLHAITKFTTQYSDSRFCITCRVAANEYSFDNFTYVEIADFNQKQQAAFICKWYSLEKNKLDLFNSQWDKVENQGFRELAKTPLLLTLICLAFDETLQFSKRRVDLYAEAVDALLKKWDSSRAIVRGDVYKQLEPVRKKQLLSFVAYNTFSKQEYLIRKNVVTEVIRRFIVSLPYWDDKNEVDAEQILKAIESHHGLLVERAQNIYSFSHLTIQEYFAALYISENVANGYLGILVDCIIKDIRWREVMLMCSSMQSNASILLTDLAQKTWEIIADEAGIVELIAAIGNEQQIWKNAFQKKSGDVSDENKMPHLEVSRELALEIAGNLSLIPEQFHTTAILRARRLVQEIGSRVCSKSELSKMSHYLQMTLLFIECLHISSVDNRSEIEEMALRALPHK